MVNNKIFVLTESRFSHDASGSVAGFTRSGSVNGYYSELVFVTFLDAVGDFGDCAVT